MDYAAKICFACHANPTQMGRDAVAVIDAAMVQAERLLGRPLKEDLIDPEGSEVAKIVIVTDNGPAYKSDRFARFI